MSSTTAAPAAAAWHDVECASYDADLGSGATWRPSAAARCST